MKKHTHLILSLAVFCGISCSTPSQQLKKGTIRAGNLEVYYERKGKGDAILLLHAGLLDHTMWNEQVKALSANYEVITIDQPFHGKTTGIDTITLAQDIIKTVLDSLHIQKVSIAGLSMGAAATEDFIIAYPERVNKAILISAGINGYEKEHPIDSLSMNWYILFSNALKGGDTPKAGKEFTKAWAEGIYRSGDSLNAPVSKFVYSKALENMQLHKLAGWPILKDNPPAVQNLASVHLPVLIIHGDKDLPYITETSRYLEKTIPGAKRIVIKDVAHMLNMEKPEELNKLIIEFLKQP